MKTSPVKDTPKITTSPVANAPAKPLPRRRIARLLARHLRRRGRGGDLFALASGDMKTVLNLGLKPGEMVVLPDGTAVEVQDRLRAEDQTVGGWKVMERYALKELSEAERRRREAAANQQEGGNA